MKPSELPFNPDGSVYHLGLRESHIADDVILVGDPGRVALLSPLFERIDFQSASREFHCTTGLRQGHRFTLLSTGIGPDNIDIVINELDVAVNADPETGAFRSTKRSLNLIRLGTCGSLRAELELGIPVLSRFAIGLDGVARSYAIEQTDEEQRLETEFLAAFGNRTANIPYAASCDLSLFAALGHLGTPGITLTAHGFYGPQGRAVRLPLRSDALAPSDFKPFHFEGYQIVNYEMESAPLFALGKALSHRCLCLCIPVANRITGQFITEHHRPMLDLAEALMDALTQSR